MHLGTCALQKQQQNENTTRRSPRAAAKEWHPPAATRVEPMQQQTPQRKIKRKHVAQRDGAHLSGILLPICRRSYPHFMAGGNCDLSLKQSKKKNMIHFRNEGHVSCQNLEMKVGCEEISGF